MGTKIAHIYSIFSHYCQDLLQEKKVNPDNYFDRIVTGNDYYNLLRQQEATLWKKPDEETPTRLRGTSSAENIMMIIF